MAGRKFQFDTSNNRRAITSAWISAAPAKCWGCGRRKNGRDWRLNGKAAAADL